MLNIMDLYPALPNSTTDLAPLVIYANTITNGAFIPLVLVSFFLIIMIGGYLAQVRFRGSGSILISFTVAAFANVGLVIVLMTTSGLVNTSYAFISAIIAVLSVFMLGFVNRE